MLVLGALTAVLAAAPADGEALAAKLAELERADLAEAARVLARRVRQPGPKMKLSAAQATAAATELLRRLPTLPSARALHRVMPRSLVELVRAVAERGLPEKEAEAMAAYLVGLVTTLRLGGLSQFDENHSHVIGRQWPEIDYSGEGTTWQQRRAAWIRHGVVDFNKAIHLHRYFTAEEKLPYFRRIYRPAGRMASVPPPSQ